MNKIFRLLQQTIGDHKIKFIFLNFITLLSTIADMLSLGTLTAYVSFIFDKQILIEILTKYNLTNLSFFLYQDNFLIILTFILIIIFIIKNLFLFFVNFYEINFIKDLRIKKTRNLFSKYINLNYKDFVSKNFSFFQRSIFNEIQLLTVTLQQIIIFIKESTLICFVLILFLIIDLKLTIFAFSFLFVVSILFFTLTKKRLKNYGLLGLDHRRLKHKVFNEFGSFFKDIKIFNLKSYFLNSFIFSVKGDETYRAYGDIISRTPRLIFEILCVALIFVILFYFQINNIDFKYYVTTITFFGLGLVRMVPSFNLINQVLSKIKINEASSLSILNELQNLPQDKKYHDTKNIYKFEFEENLKLDNIYFNYNNNKVLENFNLDIKKNSTICIYGPSGSGKTTILNIVGGLVIPESGKVLCDNFNIFEKSEAWQKNMISYMGQDTFVLNDTLEKNISLEFSNNEVDFLHLNSLIRDLGLKKLSNREQIFENTQNLSGGEKQRIGFARAVYKNSPILLFDEPTNNLDEENENIILDKIRLLKGKKTIIIVTHNKKFKELCDEVIIL